LSRAITAESSDQLRKPGVCQLTLHKQSSPSLFQRMPIHLPGLLDLAEELEIDGVLAHPQ
jgi:hypothetical protein